MKKATDWLIARRGYEYFAAPVLALVALCIAFAGRGIWPFGDLSVAIWDMDIQYVGLFGWLCRAMHGQGSLAYSFSAGMGEGMASTIAYYLASPFNLLAWFFDAEHVPQLLSILTLAKLSTAALTCYSFLRKRHRSGAIHVALAVAYALCGWAVAQCSNIMWLDGFIMLPLVALGTWRVIARGSCLTLFLSVAGTVLFNWYTGYMNCLFSVFYFFVCWLAQPRGQIRVRQGLRYGATMVLGLGASLALFLPAVLGLLGTKEGTNSLDGVITLAMSLNPLKLFSSFAVTATPGSDWDVMPSVYTGELAVVLVAAYLMNRRVPRRERVLHALLLCVVLFSMCFWGPDQIWSCFKHVTSYYFRYAYVASFSMAAVAALGWESLGKLEGAERRKLALVSAAAPCAIVCAAVCGYRLYKGGWAVAPKGLVLTAVLLLAYGALVWLAGESRRTRARALLACACAATFAEVTYDAYSVFSHYTRNVSDWGSYVSELEDLYGSVPSGEGGDANVRVATNGFTFRGEGNNNVTTTEGFLMGVSSPEEYTSTMSAGMPDLLSKLGYCATNEVFGYYYNAPMTLSDALFGIDYGIGLDQPALSEKLADVDISSKAGAYKLWRNTAAMPAAYGIRSGAGSINWPSDSADEFDNQTELYAYGNVSQWEGFSPVKDPFANQAAMLADMTGEAADGVYAEATVEELVDEASENTRVFEVTVTSDGPLYLHVPIMSTLRCPCDVYVDKNYKCSVGGNFNNSVIYVGEYSAGQTLRIGLVAYPGVDCRPSERVLLSSSASDLVVAKTLDLNELQRQFALLDSNAAQVETYEDGHVKLSFSADSDETLCTVIPYDSGWTVTVDGEKTEVRALYGGLCGVDLTAGEHVVEFTYVTPGLAIGCAATVASAVAFAAWRAIARRRAR